MAKLIVALSLLLVGLANGLANFGGSCELVVSGSTCELDSDYKERFEKLEARIEEMMLKNEEMMSVVESIASKPCCEGTAQPTVTPPELNGCGQPCADVVTLDEAAIDPGGTGIYVVDEPDTCYEIDGNFYDATGLTPSLFLKVEVSCAKITVPSDSDLYYIEVFSDNAEIVNEGQLRVIEARLRVKSSADGTKITNTGYSPTGLGVESPGADITVSAPGHAKIFANGGTDITFDCYGADVMVPAGGDAICGLSVPTRAPTPKPTLGFGFTP